MASEDLSRARYADGPYRQSAEERTRIDNSVPGGYRLMILITKGSSRGPIKTSLFRSAQRDPESLGATLSLCIEER